MQRTKEKAPNVILADGFRALISTTKGRKLEMNTTIIAASNDSITITREQLREIRSESIAACDVAMENLKWLEGIFRSVVKLDEREFSAITSISEAGVHLTSNSHNLIDCIKATLEEAFAKATA